MYAGSREMKLFTICFLYTLRNVHLFVAAHLERHNQSKNSFSNFADNYGSTDSDTAELSDEMNSTFSRDDWWRRSIAVNSTSNKNGNDTMTNKSSQSHSTNSDVDVDRATVLGLVNSQGQVGNQNHYGVTQDDHVYLKNGHVSTIGDLITQEIFPEIIPHKVEQPTETGVRKHLEEAPSNGLLKSSSVRITGLGSLDILKSSNVNVDFYNSLTASRNLATFGNVSAFDSENITETGPDLSTFATESSSASSNTDVSIFGTESTIHTTMNVGGSEQIANNFLQKKIDASRNTTSSASTLGSEPKEYIYQTDRSIQGDQNSITSVDASDHMTHEDNNSYDILRQRPSQKSVTHLLDSLMLGYDKSLRPGFGGNPLVVKADIEIRSMGPISEKDMIYSMDCYFRQVWTDRRLSFNATQEKITNVSLNVMMLERIWRPDTIFINGGPSYVHTITTPNKFFRLSYDGKIIYSQRLTIKASCPMHLEKFPMDTQKCPLHITSFGYPVTDVIYEWHYGTHLAAVAANDMRLSQFDLQGMPACNVTRAFKGTQHSVLTVYFDFRRHTGYFLIQVYLPCCLLVVLSWVSFWINREATADRISLGSLTMLTMTFLVLDTRNDLPRVAYSTALDVYVFMCFCFIFASIIQFAAVHFFTKYGTEDAETLPVLDTDDEDDEDDSHIDPCELSSRYDSSPEPGSVTGCIRKMWRCLMSTRSKRFNKNVRNALGLNSVSKIDKVARVLFPAAFCGLNIVYWMSYW